MIYPLVGFLTQLFQKRQIPLSTILSLINNRDKPLSFFGRNINWMKPGLISRVVKKYLKTGEIQVKDLPIRERFFAEVNSIKFKSILINRIDALCTKIDKLDILRVRLNILDQLITSSELEDFFKDYIQKGSLELEKDLIDRSYFKDPSFQKFRKMYLEISSFADILMTKSSTPSLTNLRALRLGMDIDLAYGTWNLLKTEKYKLMYLNAFRLDREKFFMSKLFADLTLEDLLSHFEKLQSLLKSIQFYKIDKNLQKEVLDNPLKVLDFIKDIHKPEFYVKSDFVKFGGQYIDSSAIVDKSPGYRPNIILGFKPRISIKTY
jgi:hypothetical protein